jgi:hypothetical protein
MKLSQKRKDAIYRTVNDRIVNLRIEVSGFLIGQDADINRKIGEKLDMMIARAQGDAASAAVRVAENGDANPRA